MFVGGRDIKSLKTKCDSASNGCQWTGELGSIEKHSAACDYALLPCLNECTDINAGDKILKVLRKDMDKHLNEDCPRREYICPHCEESGEYQKMTTTHLEECNYVEVPCPNKGCNKHVKRNSVLVHRYAECNFEKVRCKYQNIGCQEELHHIDLEKHENDTQYHIRFATKAIHENATSVDELKTRVDESVSEIEAKADQQQQVIKRLENTITHFQSIIASQSKEINELRLKLERSESDEDDRVSGKQPRRASSNLYWNRRWVQASNKDSNQKSMFKFTEFAQRKSHNESVYSPPMYSSPTGYKMCLNANGNGKGEGGHVSVFAYLLRGENDDHLPWPFTGKVVIELLNQLEDRDHWTKTVQFKRNEYSSKRVVDSDDDRADTGYGRPKYIPHSSLGYNPVKNCQYLKDDCLYFRFEIKCESAPKPRLASANVV